MLKNSHNLKLHTLVILLIAAAFVSFGCKKQTEPTEEPTTQIEQPQAEVQTPAVEEPAVVEEPVVEESAVEEPNLEEPKVEEPKAEEPIAADPNAVEAVEDPNQASAVPEGMIELETDLPKAMFVGTPKPIKVPNLEPVMTSARPPFYVPEGTTNVALNKPLSGSDEEPIIGELEMITDGDKEAADGHYVELGPELQYVTIDLGQQCDIYALMLWHFHKQACVYFDVIVQVADDPDFIMNVNTIFNNDNDNSAGLGIGNDMHYVESAEGKLIDAKGVQGRYVRLYSNKNTSNDLNHYIEVEVFGKPVE